MQKCSNKVNKVGSILCPIKSYSNRSTGEGFCFCFKSAVHLLLKAHKLLDVACTRLKETSSLIDGATLTRSLGVVTAGVKLIDIAYVDPTSSKHANTPMASNCFV